MGAAEQLLEAFSRRPVRVAAQVAASEGEYVEHQSGRVREICCSLEREPVAGRGRVGRSSVKIGSVSLVGAAGWAWSCVHGDQPARADSSGAGRQRVQGDHRYAAASPTAFAQASASIRAVT
jgi:hypothetical protein